MVPTVEEIEEYFETLEQLLFSSLETATPDLPQVRDVIHRIWLDITRYGPPGLPSFPDLHVPGLGAFEVPPSPPPPPPKTWLEKTGDWIGLHPWKTSGIVVGVLGAGLLVGYGTVYLRTLNRRRSRVRTGLTGDRKKVVVVLGGDHPFGLPLILELEKQGYIVITSVSVPDAVHEIESRGHGFVRALVLDPNEPGTIPIFLRSLASTLSRRFPINAPGDPHASALAQPSLHSIISLLTLPGPSIHTVPAPLEQLSLRSTYLPHLLSTHIAPLQTLQALLPLLRADPARTRDALANGLPKKSIIVCVPATDARVGLPFAGVRAMSAAATLRGIDVLRREITVASLSNEAMRGIRVVTVDVGAVGQLASHELLLQPHDVYRAMEDWTPSEKVTYGPAFSFLLDDDKSGVRHAPPRKPADISVFVDNIVDVVNGGRRRTFGPGQMMCVVGLALTAFDTVRDWIRGDRFSIGAGAGTYTFASYLPPALLDVILNIPHLLISWRNRLLLTPPRIGLPQAATLAAHPSTVISDVISSKGLNVVPPAPGSEIVVESLSDAEDAHRSETGSEADVESNAGDGYGSGVESSWVSLHSRTGKSTKSAVNSVVSFDA